MKKLNEKLSEALDIEPIEITNTEIIAVEPKDSVDDDAEYARQNIRGLIEKGNDAANHIVEIAKQSEHPRAFEVAAGLLKNLADMNKDLLEIQKRKRDLRPVETTNNINVDKAVFVGSTKDLVKFLKSNKDE
jgi:succinyl-CoA synthetase beta subunit